MNYSYRFNTEAKPCFANTCGNTKKSSSRKRSKKKKEISLQLAKARLGLRFDLRPTAIKRF